MDKNHLTHDAPLQGTAVYACESAHQGWHVTGYRDLAYGGIWTGGYGSVVRLVQRLFHAPEPANPTHDSDVVINLAGSAQIN